MQTSDFFRSRIDAMIDLSDPLAVLVARLPWDQIEAALAPMFAHKDRAGQTNADVDLFGPNLVLSGAGRSNAGRFRVFVGEAGPQQLLKATINMAVAIKTVKPEALQRVLKRQRTGPGGGEARSAVP